MNSGKESTMSDQKINESIVTDEIREHMKENRIDHMTYLPDMEIIDSDIQDRVLSAMHAYDPESYTAADVRRALDHERISVEDFKVSGGDRSKGKSGKTEIFRKQYLYDDAAVYF